MKRACCSPQLLQAPEVGGVVLVVLDLDHHHCPGHSLLILVRVPSPRGPNLLYSPSYPLLSSLAIIRKIDEDFV
jgi:hypothetical protein